MAFKIDHTPWGLVTAADTASGYLNGAMDARKRRESMDQQYNLATYGQNRMDARQQREIDARAQAAKAAREAKALEDGDLGTYLGGITNIYNQQTSDPDNPDAPPVPGDYVSEAAKARTERQARSGLDLVRILDAHQTAAKKGIEAQLKATAKKRADAEYAKAMGGMGGEPTGAPSPASEQAPGFYLTPEGAQLEQPPDMRPNGQAQELPAEQPPDMTGWSTQQITSWGMRQDRLRREVQRQKETEARFQAQVGRHIRPEDHEQAMHHFSIIENPHASRELKIDSKLWLLEHGGITVSAMNPQTARPEQDPDVLMAKRQYVLATEILKKFQTAGFDDQMMFKEKGVTEHALQEDVARAARKWKTLHEAVSGRSGVQERKPPAVQFTPEEQSALDLIAPDGP